MKRCGRCRAEEPLAHFHRRRGGERHAEFVEWYLALKDGKPCADCGQSYHPAAMQWDHLPGEAKLASVADLCRENNRRCVLEEIAKCELVCANRHAVRTFQRQRGVAQPG